MQENSSGSNLKNAPSQTSQEFLLKPVQQIAPEISRTSEREFYSSSGEIMSTQANEAALLSELKNQRRIEANQKNSQLSTGPKSEQGKAISSQNNFRHGFAGAFRVLTSENLDEFNQLVRQLTEEHQPSTPTETLLVTQMSQAWWLRTRALLLQNACFQDDAVDQKQLALYLRYQTTNERSFHKALNEFLNLRAEKRKVEIGFESQQVKQSRARQQAELLATRARQQAEEHARKQAVEKRRQELHKWTVLLAQARVDNQELQNMKLETPEHHITGRVQRIIAAEKAA